MAATTAKEKPAAKPTGGKAGSAEPASSRSGKQTKKTPAKRQTRAKTAAKKTAPAGALTGAAGAITQIPLNMIAPSPLNPRKSFTEEDIESLAESLLAMGQLQNISVRPLPEGRTMVETLKGAPYPQFEIVYGERRWRAMGRLVAEGRWPADHPVDAKVVEIDDARHLEEAIVENLDRKDVHPLEQAEAFARLKRIRLKETGDDTKATGLMAEKTGQSVRNVQYYVQVAEGLSDKAKEAWKRGEITSRKVAIGLARLDPAKQAEALKANGVHKFRDAEHLKQWLERESVPVSVIKFDLDLYRKKGAGIVFGEDGAPERLTNVGLATSLQADWAKAEAERLTEAEGLTRPPEKWDQGYYGPWAFMEGWQVATTKTPKELCRVRWFIDSRTCEAHVQVCVSEKALEDLKKKAAAKTDETGAPPLAARNWRAGAEARTTILREITAASPALAESMAIIALLPGPTYWSGGSAILHMGPQNGWDHGKVASALFVGLEGFEDGHVMDRRAALTFLLAMPPEDRRTLFAAVIASLVSESTVTQGGAPEEAVAIAAWAESCEGGLAPAKPLERLEGLADKTWFDLYTTPQLEAMLVPCGAALRAPEGQSRPKKKAELAEWIAKHRAPGWVPPEARFLPKEDAQAAVGKMLRGEAD